MREVLRGKLPLLALVAWCVAMLIVRMIYSSSTVNAFLLWNLALACVPVVASTALVEFARRRTPWMFAALAFVVWLAFLPNAPYLVTDLKHLSHVAPVPLWYDVALYGSYAATGALLGYASVAEVESVLRARVGALAAFAVSMGALLLAGFGIYLGRFLRFNSWDVITAPGSLGHQVARQLAHPVTHPQTWEVPLVYGVGLVLGYVALRAVAPLLVGAGSTSNKRFERSPRAGTLTP